MFGGSKNYKFLGINIKTKLNLKFLISHVCGKIARSVGIFHRLLYYFPRKILVNLYYSLVYPYLLYCVISWGGTYPSCLAPLKVLQKRIVRLLAGNHYLAHSEPLFAWLKVLRVDDIYRFVLAQYMFHNRGSLAYGILMLIIQEEIICLPLFFRG